MEMSPEAESLPEETVPAVPAAPAVQAPQVTEKSEAKQVAPAPGPFQEALKRGDAGALASLLKKHSKHADAAEVQRRLQAEPIYCLTFKGSLSGGGDESLLGELLHCKPADRSRLMKLPFTVQIRERRVKVRFQHQYQTGLGRKIGKIRLAPHPKSVSIEVSLLQEKAKPEKIEGKTPHIPPDDLTAAGLTEQEVWQRTLEPLLAKLHQALQKER